MVSTTYDPEAEALYIKYKENHKVVKTVNPGNDAYIDLSSDNDILGIEVILSDKLELNEKISKISGLEILV